jgi:hypothetical protein
MNLLLVVGRLDTRSTLEMDLIAADVKYTFNKMISDTRLFMIAGRLNLSLQVFCTFYTLTTSKINTFSKQRMNRGCPSTTVHSRELGEIHSNIFFCWAAQRGAQMANASAENIPKN